MHKYFGTRGQDEKMRFQTMMKNPMRNQMKRKEKQMKKTWWNILDKIGNYEIGV